MRKSFIHFLWGLLATCILLGVIAFTAISFGWIGYMPPVEELQNPINRFATQVYSADGKLMGTWSYNRENRICVDYLDLSPYLVKALVATEDVRFYDHSGIDFYALGRAVVKRGLMGQLHAGGGSTITQQLAKQLFTENAHSTLERLLQKPIEWVIAVKLERDYTKEEIVTMYLNYFDFLHNAVGIKTAANTYFNKEPHDLNMVEAATLIGLCKNPSYFNPVRNPDRCRERRNVVLSQMHKAGYISQAEYEENSDKPLTLNFHRTDHKDGIATYFRDYLRRIMMAKKPNVDDYPLWNKNKYHEDSIAWAIDPLYGWCNKNYKKNGDPYNVYTDGLKVYTTIDSRMQRYAEEAVYGHVGQYLQPRFFAEKKNRSYAPFSDGLTMEQVRSILKRSMKQSERYTSMKASGSSDVEIRKAFRTPIPMSVFTYHGEVDTVMSPLDSIRYYKSFLRAGFMSMNPQNGAVKAYVGGLDFVHFQYDMCMEGRRQVGSTIKPFLYALAMENGFSPCDMAPNVQRTYIVAGQPWTPRNSSHSRYGQNVTLKWGLAQSNNWISAYLMSKLNPSSFVQLIHEFGIKNQDIHPSMALCLGPCDISVGEMVSAYSAFVNHGIRCAPMFVTKIVDSEGNTVAQFQPRMNEVISEESAYKMLVLLKAVIDEGTGRRMRFKYNMTCEMGGKTGTTNRNSDAWFVGFTPTLVSGCWVGGEERDIHFDSMNMGQGATMALPIWAYYMKKVFRDHRLGYNEDAIFDMPANYNPCYTESTEAESNGIDEIYE
jgi:penicillin-binding protein 1A